MSEIVPVYDHSREIKQFVEFGLWGGAKEFGSCTTLGYATAQEGLIAGFIYHNYEPDAGLIELSGFASRHDWCTKTRVREIYGYPFEQLGVRLMIGRHSEKNRPVRRIWRALGAKEYLIDDLRADGEAEAVAVLHRENWMNSKFMRSRKNG